MVTAQSKIAWISETLCIGCGICIKVSDILFIVLNYNLKMKFKNSEYIITVFKEPSMKQ